MMQRLWSSAKGGSLNLWEILIDQGLDDQFYAQLNPEKFKSKLV